jgi:hypothetical protein
VRAALVDSGYPTPFVKEIANALARAGHDACVVTCGRGAARRWTEDGFAVVRVPRLPEAPLRVRGFERPLTHVPFAAAELLRGRFDAVHAFSPADAAAARAWRRVRGGPVVFTLLWPPSRDNVSNRRLTLRLLEEAVGRSDAVLAAGEEVRAATWRWLAVEAEAVAPADHPGVYDALLVRRRRAQRPGGPPSSRPR